MPKEYEGPSTVKVIEDYEDGTVPRPSASASFDTDAQAFFTAAGITDATQKSATNQLVLDLKSASIWTKMVAIWPFVGGSAATHKYNLKDPRDLDAAFRLVFTGGWTHSLTGALPNGSTAWADTKLNPSTALVDNNVHMSFYSRTASTAGVEMGTFVSSTARWWLAASLGGSLFSDCFADADRVTGANGSSLGMYLSSRSATNVCKVYKNGAQFGGTVVTDNGAPPNRNMALGAEDQNGSITNFSNKQMAFASMGSSLSDTEAANLYTAVQAFETTLSRQV